MKKMSLKLSMISTIFLISYASIVVSTFAHNIDNGGCKNHCRSNSQEINKSKKNILFKNKDNSYGEKNSCINNFLCRGWILRIV